MSVLRSETLPVQTKHDIVRARQAVRTWSRELGLGLVDQTKMITAASELARNTVDHGGGGSMRMEVVEGDRRRGLRLVFEDDGPGIPDLERAMRDGYSTGSGLGLGLSGARRLVNELDVEARPEGGTRVSILRWLP
ncbi:MAG TPA: ATP-binding protein [Thermoanaerobaculia bacterium]|nr:ATP-binding protein [Thermoanaerobaculia bacterium]